ncbi:DUF6221 family protein [Amycolatopsis anabasis]|uniref:DUF6221 family protein n=1 Tax=Amycolatopsis anabasis TaxID=1840409 RepID=UPI00131A635E|nr:DUF6221 family protein [Amycolatopsis anabasis]
MACIVSFLRARIHEDETRAVRGTTGGPWSPQRVLAECRAKRLLLTALEGGQADERMSRMLRAMALPYSAHPEFEREWLPG